MATEKDVVEFIQFAWVHFVRGVEGSLADYQDKKWARADYGQTFFSMLERPNQVEIKVDGEVFEIEVRKKPRRRAKKRAK